MSQIYTCQKHKNVILYHSLMVSIFRGVVKRFNAGLQNR